MNLQDRAPYLDYYAYRSRVYRPINEEGRFARNLAEAPKLRIRVGYDHSAGSIPRTEEFPYEHMQRTALCPP